MKASYLLTDTNELQVHFTGHTTQATVINMTNHTYWNLSGNCKKKIYDQLLEINAETYLPVDDMVGVLLKANYQIPTSEKRNVENTPFDFRTPAPCRQALAIDGGGKPGLDHCFCLSGEGMRVAGSLVDVDSGRKVEVLTTMPGMQVYMANWVDGEFPHLQHNGVALECQHYPDSPNHPEFPTTVLYPNQTYDERIVFRFLYVCFVFSYKQVNTTISS